MLLLDVAGVMKTKEIAKIEEDFKTEGNREKK